MKENKHEYFNGWIKISLVNFFVVALVGVVLRYKINFPLPFVNQKYLLHGHSHFAFAGWVSQALMVFIIQYLSEYNANTNLKLYNRLLWANLATAYGMLLSFPFEGYAFVSIVCSTLSILVSYIFIAASWKDLKKIVAKKNSATWLKASLFLYALSSIGAFTLALLMANKIAEQDFYFAAVYFFLHFQYNGWFLFACFGLFFHQLERLDSGIVSLYSKKLFRILFITCFPTFLLSALWMKVPEYFYLLALSGAIVQLGALVYVIQIYNRSKKILQQTISQQTKYLWFMAFVAFSIKVVLQALSTIPALSQYAFGFRPVVIGYLHLSFLCIISFFILGYISEFLLKQKIKLPSVGIMLFVAGVLITEIILMVQGFAAISFNYLPYTNIILFIVAIVLASGLLLIAVKKIPSQAH